MYCLKEKKIVKNEPLWFHLCRFRAQDHKNGKASSVFPDLIDANAVAVFSFSNVLNRGDFILILPF